MSKYEEKPHVVWAVQYLYDASENNQEEVISFIEKHDGITPDNKNKIAISQVFSDGKFTMYHSWDSDIVYPGDYVVADHNQSPRCTCVNQDEFLRKYAKIDE